MDEYCKGNEIIDFMKKSLLAEELLFPTLLVNSNLKDSLINLRTTEADYTNSHPKVLSEVDIPMLMKSQALFARKFDYDLDLFNKIDEEIKNLN